MMPRLAIEWQDARLHKAEPIEPSESFNDDVPYSMPEAVEYWNAPHRVRLRDWIAGRLQRAYLDLEKYIESDRDKSGGVPVIRGTRVKVAQLLAELAEGQDITEIAEDLDLDQETLSVIMKRLAVLLDRPFK
jgi:uncharacterized protein (DUF433 family)